MRLNKFNICILACLLFSLATLQIYANDNSRFNYNRINDKEIKLKFSLGNWNPTPIEKGSSGKIKINSEAQNYLYIDEEETLPVFSTIVAIPEGMNAILENSETFVKTYSAENYAFKQILDLKGIESEQYPVSRVEISEPAQFRDFRIININVFPFQYNARKTELSVADSIDIQIRLEKSSSYIPNPLSGYFSSSFENLYSSLILNYNEVRDESLPLNQPKLLIIYNSAATTTFLNKLNDLVTWKRQKGYIVNTVSTAVTGTVNTDIKSYILNQYNNAATRPDVVLLLGDIGGSYNIPTFTESNDGFVSSYGDYTYTLLAGNDNFGDVQIGRISVASDNEFINYVAKIMLYEKNININTAQWLNRMLLVGDTEPSGISCMYTNLYIKEISRVVNPNYSYTELYSAGPVPADINQAINVGVGIYNYRGYIGMSEWTPSSSLINSYRLNHGVFITCATGNIQNTSTIEDYVKLGTEASPAGGITAIGMSTSSTHTGFNNCLTGGIFDGIFNRNMRTMGEALLYSKCYMQSVYGVAHPSGSLFFSRICNLIGDPTVEIFVTIPKTFQITAPTTILACNTNFEITVKDMQNNSVANAAVNVMQTSSGLNQTVFTDALGKAFLTIPSVTTGDINVTISKHDYKPSVQTVTVNGTGLIYQSLLIDDDNSGSSIGNNNQVINAGETIELGLRIKNTSISGISSIACTASITDPYIQLVSNNLSFPNAGQGVSVNSSQSILMNIDPSCPDNHYMTLYFSGTSSGGTWNAVTQIQVKSPDLDYSSHVITGTNSYLEPGELTQICINLSNNGSETAGSVYGVLRSLHPYVTVTDSLKYLGDVNAGSAFNGSSIPYSVRANMLAITGMVIPMELYLYNNTGYNDTEYFSVTIGHVTLTDPLGQDAYGYYIFDMGDISYPYYPTYNWIGIAPGESGLGTALAISDAGVPYATDEGDQVGCDASEIVDLPFTFRYYGIDYSQITVVSNGFIAFGATGNHDFRNWRLPGPVGPNAMIAAFWDDLSTMTGGIYKYYDAVNHYFVIEWYNLRLGRDRTSEETFQIILYDPLNYVTSTGDGSIKIQYKVFNNSDSPTTNTTHGCYSTIGIKDHTGLVGLEYTFNNTYPVAAKPLTNQSAIYITTNPLPLNTPFLKIGEVTNIDTNENGICEPGELVQLRLRIDNLGSGIAANTAVSVSENDPWIELIEGNALLGNISGLSSSVNENGITIRVVDGCPNDYTAHLTANITTTNGYSVTRNFEISVHTPILTIAQVLLTDTNANGYAEPGETINLGIRLSNSGVVSAAETTAFLTTTDSMISIVNNTSQYNTIFPQSSETNLTYFTINVSPYCLSDYSANISLEIHSYGYTVTRNFSIVVHKPSLELFSWMIDDLQGNCNGIVNPGESGYLILNLYNNQVVDAQNVVINLSSNNSLFVLNNSGIEFRKIINKHYGQIAVPYQASVSIANGTQISVECSVSALYVNTFISNINLTVGSSELLYNFEANNGSFTYSNSLSPGWAYGSSSYASAHSGIKIWGCVLSGQYGNSATYELISPSIALAGNPELSFWHRYNLEYSAVSNTAYDGGRVLVSNNNGSTWNVITPVGGYPHSNVNALSGPGYSGNIPVWTLAVYDLSGYANQTIKIKWQMKTDTGVTADGWFIDDVNLRGTNINPSPLGVIGGTITLSPDNGNLEQTVVYTHNKYQVFPASNGLYQFRLPSGTYTIKAKLEGYTEKTTSGSIVLNSTVGNRNLNLEYMIPPENLSWKVANNVLYLKWNYDSRLTFLNYNVYRKTATNEWSVVAQVTQPEYSETLTDFTDYEYRITALYATYGESVSTRSIQFSFPDNIYEQIPRGPENTIILRNSNGTMISWDEVQTSVDNQPLTPWEYRIYASDVPFSSALPQILIGTTTQTSYTVNTSDASPAKFYQVKAFIGFDE
jgi:hypothetical protein